MARRPFPRGGIRTRLPVTIYRRSSDDFSPTEIEGLALWLDASDSSTLFQNSDGTVPATATSDPVGYWADKSGNGRHAVQATAGSRPVVSATTTNGKRALAFNGTSSTLAIANFNAESSLTGLTRYMVLSQSASGPLMTGTGGSGGNFFQQVSFLGRFAAGSAHYSASMPNYSFLLAGTRIIGSLYDGTAGSIAAGIMAFGDGAALSQDSTSGTLPTTLASGSPTYFIGSNLNANNFLNGRTLEVLTYNRTLTSSERQRLERYLAAKYGITLAPTVSNADAQDWVNRVYQNGGTVSAATAGAVNSLCDSLESASLRDRFYRLNLFCGSNLNAALVPLYRGPSLGGTQYGNATDTNVGGLFVSANYSETGAAAGGLQSNGTKWLDTGFATNTVAEGNRHISVYENAKATRSLDVSIGSEGATGNTQHFLLATFNTADTYRFAFGATSAAVDAGAYTGGAMWLGVNQSAGQGILYKNGISAVTGTVAAATPTSASMFIFALNRAGSGADGADARLGSYSIGLSMTATQAAAYYTAMQNFQTALTRNV